MNIRKPTDYTAMFTTLDTLMAAQLPQMELYCEIGRLVSGRAEKGAAVAASEYLQATYPTAEGFSPRNLRRMRDFYRMYGNMPELLAEAMRLSWTQNVVIMEAGLTMDERCWYIRKAAESGLSKTELLRMIERSEHSEIALGENEDTCYTVENDEFSEKNMKNILFICHGNICRSPMAEFVMKDLVKKAGLASQFHIESAATSREEIGNPVYPPARRKLAEHGISCDGHAARQLTNRTTTSTIC